MKTHLLSGALRSFALTMALGLGAYAQAPVLITQPIEESNLVTLAGNLRPEANAANDRGAVPDSMRIDHMLMQLKRSPQQEEAAEALVDQLHDPQSPNYHQWLTAAQLGQRFGLAPADLNKITGWLQSHGFQASVYPNGMLLDLSGTAAQVRTAFHTEIHNLSVAGTPHIANMSNPQIPAALAPAVAGIVSLHNFWPHPMYERKTNYTTSEFGGTYYLVGARDLEVIYNMNPLFSKGVTGAGQKLVVVEDTNIYSSADWNSFRSTFGLDKYTSGSLVSINPNSSANNCSNPGVNGDDGEAAIDMEYASAAAPGATIEVAACSDTQTTFGGLIAIENILNASSTPPSIMSMSYGECEALTGASLNAAFNSTFQQAVMEGVSVFVSSGDDAAAGCDRDNQVAFHGIAITGWGGTPYNVAVGGTDFGDSYLGQNTDYWRANNTQYYESAKSYIPEIPWNDTCASVLISKAEGYSKPYGANGFCNSPTGQEFFLGTVGGSGGPSGCATGDPGIFGVVSGTCKGYKKPSWQKGVIGIPQDGVRDVPDVSLFAANGVWGHFYPFCYSDPNFGGVACSGAPNTWPGAGGTSFSSPIMAGIQALVNQATGSAQGNPNYVYYQLAATEYGASGNPSCNSTKGMTAASTCTFYDVTLGDMDVPCALGVAGCYKTSGPFGVLSTSDTSYMPAYPAAVGWDFATGIGSVNATNLVNNWKSVAP
jgi:subtilase family serine protease